MKNGSPNLTLKLECNRPLMVSTIAIALARYWAISKRSAKLRQGASRFAVRIINAINPTLTIHGDRGNSSAFPERKVDIWIFNVQKIGKGQENFQIKGDRLLQINTLWQRLIERDFTLY